VENRFFEQLDPRRMTPETRARWEPRATSDEPLSSPHGHDWYRIPYWMRDGVERAGTFALATSPMGTGLVTVSSLYTLPSHRRRGVAGRVLGRAYDALTAAGLAGLRVPAYWTWQPAVRFYLGLGMWILNWKHSLLFVRRRGQPEHRIEVDEQRGEARFSIVRDGEIVPLLGATREGERLGWTELAAYSWDEDDGARETFAVALATHGFPLVRSDAAWAERHLSSDAGDPEGLACKIEAWEAWDRRSGHLVRTPRIPGIAYRDWDEID
jgi:GNAT superfamily N-acetyltransferase